MPVDYLFADLMCACRGSRAGVREGAERVPGLLPRPGEDGRDAGRGRLVSHRGYRRVASGKSREGHGAQTGIMFLLIVMC